MKLGRNDSCPCGSGKKLKKCCAAKFEARLVAQNISEKGAEPTQNECNQLIALFKAGRYAELESRARLFIERYSESGFVWKILGVSLNAQGKDALFALQKATELLPNDAEAHSNLGVALQDLGQLDAAMASYRRVIEIKPDFAETLSNLGHALLNRGLLKESVYHFQQAFSKRVGWHRDGDVNLLSGLEYAFIELTNKCNFHCDFCPSDSQQRAKEFMSMELVQQLFDEFAENILAREVNLHLMGEPTLHPNLMEILACASSKNIKITLVTNGSTLNAKTIPKILDVLYGNLIVSLQTPTRETFIHRGNTGLGWDSYIANIRTLIQEYLRRIALNQTFRTAIELRVLVTKDSQLTANIIETLEDVSGVIHEWRNFVAETEIEFGLTSFNRQEPSLEMFSKHTAQAEIKYPLQQGVTLSFWQGFTFANSMLDHAYSLKNKSMAKFCHHPFIDVAILSNGDVTLCCFDYDGKLAVGNIKNSTIKTILNSKPTMDLRAAMFGRYPLPLYCQQCQAEALLSDRPAPSVL